MKNNEAILTDELDRHYPFTVELHCRLDLLLHCQIHFLIVIVFCLILSTVIDSNPHYTTTFFIKLFYNLDIVLPSLHQTQQSLFLQRQGEVVMVDSKSKHAGIIIQQSII